MNLYNLEKLSVLVADDDEFSRSTLCSVLRGMKVGKLVVARDGGEAINHLKMAGFTATKPGEIGIDIIMCDWLMSPVSGAMLIRWLRRSEESPDRFIPVIAVSGAVDIHNVQEARDLGVNEFLTKPYSTKSVAAKIMSIIDQPRQFIYNGEYFGPDRRRQDLPYKGFDRRKIGMAEMEIIQTGKRPESLNTKAKIWLFDLPNKLKAKLGVKDADAGSIDPTLLRVAEQQLQDMSDDYSDWVRGNLAQLQMNYEQLTANPKNPWKYIQNIHNISHELRGQGETFGYNLITIFCKSLCDFTEAKNVEIDERLMELIKAHIDGIQVVIRSGVKDDGGTVGAELLSTLDEAKDKFYSKAKKKSPVTIRKLK
ncbi:MAG: response regulator [Alphaproteobacteria bacterium]|nr:MAG: response regulator [Alphaproteobacteria bacterium]